MINSTAKIRVFINGLDYTDYLVEGSISDDSAYTSNIITSAGSLKLAGSADVLDFNKTIFPVGSNVTLYVTLSNGSMSPMPRGNLLILSSVIDINEPSITFELGCTLNYLTAREANYEEEIEDLIQTFIPTDVKESFVVEENDISTLNNLLDVSGLVIFQDTYGTIQSVDKFGTDGLGAAVASAKLVSFDKHSAIDVESIGGAIEELPSAVIVEATTEIDVDAEEASGDESSDGFPPPFISSTTTRSIKIPDAYLADAFFNVRNVPDSADSQSEVVPGCGSVSDPEVDAVQYGYTVSGEVNAIEKDYTETVTQGGYTSYEGPGNQVDFEYDFEHCSAGTYASAVLSGLLDKHVEAANTEKQEAQSFCGKVNQAFTARDDYNSREKTVVYYYSEDSAGNLYLENVELDEESQINENAAAYYACIGEQYLEAAEGIAGGAENLAKAANTIVDDYLKKYGYSSWNTKEYFYNSSDAVSKTIENNYIHPASSSASAAAINSLTYKTQLNPYLDKLRWEYATGGFDYTSFSNVYGTSFDSIVSGDGLITSHSNSYKDPGGVFNLILARRTTTTYTYSDLYVEESIEVVDYDNPINSYSQVNYSSTGSSSAEEPDRIEIQRDADGNVYSSDTETESLELEYTQTVTLSGNTTNVSSSWLGQPGPQDKVISLPMDFAPIVQKYDSDGDAISFDSSSVLSTYEQILEKYAENEAKKIAADNSGFRITESGTRAELFGYYPYYPIDLNIASLGKRYGLRAASSSWAFDKDNVLCSIDCFTTSEITSSVDQPEISPYIYTTITKVEGVSTVAPETLNLPSTSVTIQVETLPTTGTLALNGNAVSVGDVITVADIEDGDLVYTPPTNDTTELVFSYEVLDTNGNPIGSGDNIFPVDQYDFVETAFADGGEFTDNTTNGGYSAGAGDFDTGTRPGGNQPLNGGDFDTGAEVVALAPLPSSYGAHQNGEVDVEATYGSNVVDQDGTTIGTDQLPGPAGDNQGLLEIEIDFKFKTINKLTVTSEIIIQLGWDYGFISVSTGTPIDNGTVTAPINYNLNFGTIASPLTPALSSSVS
jgi:hypothetical protein|tara:strand:+ start:4314 stop:7496 length:3183 start_codon:yes stop_codon:yes gene_type:complete